jgi:hypothetical protein
MKTVTTINATHVRNWLRSAGWKQTDHMDPAAIANACNRERRCVADHEAAEKWMAPFREMVQAARTAADKLKSELSPLIKEISEWPASYRRGAYLAEIEALNKALTNVQPAFTAMHRPGGQPVPWTEFAMSLSDHVRHSPVKNLHTREAELIASAIHAVYAIEVDADAVAKQIGRKRNKRKEDADKRRRR